MTTARRKNLVLIGGGHAHMVTLANLHRFVAKGYGVTVVAPSAHHYYSGMGPGMLARIYAPDDIRFATRKVVERQGAAFVLGRAVRIDAAARRVHLEDGTDLAYDVLSCNAGSYVPQSIVGEQGENIYSVKPIERLMEAQQRLLELAGRQRVRLAVVGGGPSALEVAGNAWRLLTDAGVDRPEIQILAGSSFLKKLPEGVRQRAYRSLARRGIVVHEGDYVKEIVPGAVRLASGAEQRADFIFLALGIRPSPLFADSGLATGPDGGLLVNRFLQCPAHPEIFGGGDCIHFEPQPLDKVGVYAVRQNPVLYQNLMAALEGGQLAPFDPGGDYLLIFNLGDGRGIFHKRGLVFDGRLAFFIKDLIDRRFMRRFQAIEKP